MAKSFEVKVGGVYKDASGRKVIIDEDDGDAWYQFYCKETEDWYSINGNCLCSSGDLVEEWEESNGGSSDYYKLSADYIDDIADKFEYPYNELFTYLFRSVEDFYIGDCQEFKDLVRLAEEESRYSNYPLFDAAHFNITKAIYRLGKKDGVSVEYDKNKIKFFLDDMLKHHYDEVIDAIREAL